jgi:hypothetical protein
VERNMISKRHYRKYHEEGRGGGVGNSLREKPKAVNIYVATLNDCTEITASKEPLMMAY